MLTIHSVVGADFAAEGLEHCFDVRSQQGHKLFVGTIQNGLRINFADSRRQDNCGQNVFDVDRKL